MICPSNPWPGAGRVAVENELSPTFPHDLGIGIGSSVSLNRPPPPGRMVPCPHGDGQASPSEDVAGAGWPSC